MHVGSSTSAVDAERPGRAGDGTEVLGVVQPLEDGDGAGGPQHLGHRRQRSPLRPRRRLRGGGRTRRSPRAPVATPRRPARRGCSRRGPQRGECFGVSSTERTTCPESSSRSMAVDALRDEDLVALATAPRRGVGQLDVVGEPRVGRVVDRDRCRHRASVSEVDLTLPRDGASIEHMSANTGSLLHPGIAVRRRRAGDRRGVPQPAADRARRRDVARPCPRLAARP